MRYALEIRMGDEVLAAVSVLPAFDACAVEVANNLRHAVVEAVPGEKAREAHDQFLIGTDAFDWAKAAFRHKSPCVETLTLSQGRPCRTVPYPPEHVRLPEHEAHVVMTATEEEAGVPRRLRTVRTIEKASHPHRVVYDDDSGEATDEISTHATEAEADAEAERLDAILSRLLMRGKAADRGTVEEGAAFYRSQPEWAELAAAIPHVFGGDASPWKLGFGAFPTIDAEEVR